jgi:TonB-dependent starch-binding outer membrane protein SusC
MTSQSKLARLLSCGIAVAVAAGCAHGGGDAAAELGPKKVQTGYGEIRAEDVTGSVSSLDAEKLQRMRYHHLGDMIEGQVPGVSVMRLSNGGFSLRIRGVTSIMGDNEPLIVVDGVPLHPAGATRALRSINPRDVRRIDVLKGPEASIYGSRGANGVLVITTERRP